MHEQVLRQRRAALLDANTRILNDAEAAHRDLTAVEQSTIEANLNAADAMAPSAGLLTSSPGAPWRERQATLAADLDAPTKMPPIFGGTWDGNGRPIADPTARRSLPQGRSFAELFGGGRDAHLDDGGFANVNEFLEAVYRNDATRLQAAAFGEGVGSEGGFSVPTQFAGWLMDGSLEGEVVRPRASVFAMSNATRVVPAWDTADRSAGLYGGVVPVWLGENKPGTAQVGKLRQLTLEVKKLILYSAISSELLSDGLDFEAQLGTALTTSIGYALDAKFFGGTGAGVPLGILNAPCTITVDPEGAQAGDSIVTENLANMVGRLLPSSYSRAVWVCSPSCVPQLMQLVLVVGAGGTAVPAVTQIGGALSLYGRPIIVSEKMAPVGDVGDIGLFDFSAYLIGLRREVSIDRSTGPGWLNDQVSFRCSVRVDGQPALDKPVTPAGGGDTLSPFVILDART